MAKEQQEKTVKSKKGLIIMLAALLFILVGGGVAVYLLVLAPQTPESNVLVEGEIVVDNVEEFQTQIAREGVMIPIDEFVVNLANPGETKYLKFSLVLEAPIKNGDLETEIENSVPKIRDTIITILSSKTVDEISTPQGKLSLKQELLRRINFFLTKGKLLDVYISEFIIQ